MILEIEFKIKNISIEEVHKLFTTIYDDAILCVGAWKRFFFKKNLNFVANTYFSIRLYTYILLQYYLVD